jgi:hypothetical protein
MTKRRSLLDVLLVVVEIGALFVACIWGCEQNAFAGIAAPALLGALWHRFIRLPGAPVAH